MMGVVRIAVREGRKRFKLSVGRMKNPGVVLSGNETSFHSLDKRPTPCLAARPAWTSTSGRRMGS
jgi:hypothetical protein